MSGMPDNPNLPDADEILVKVRMIDGSERDAPVNPKLETTLDLKMKVRNYFTHVDRLFLMKCKIDLK